jgi:hypothetical protein
MMDTNPFEKLIPAPYVSQRVGLPLDEYMGTADVLQNRWEQGAAQIDVMEDVLKNIYANTLDADRPLVDQVTAKFLGTLEGFNKRQDYHNFTRDIRKSSMDLTSTITPIIANKATVDAELDAIRNREDISSETYNRIRDHILSNAGALNYDPTTLRVIGGQFRGSKWAGDVNVRALADEMIKGFEKTGRSDDTGWILKSDGNYYNTITQKTGRKADVIKDILAQGFAADKTYNDMLNRDAMLYGEKADALNTRYLNDALNYASRKAEDWMESEQTDMRQKTGSDDTDPPVNPADYVTHITDPVETSEKLIERKAQLEKLKKDGKQLSVEEEAQLRRADILLKQWEAKYSTTIGKELSDKLQEKQQIISDVLPGNKLQDILIDNSNGSMSINNKELKTYIASDSKYAPIQDFLNKVINDFTYRLDVPGNREEKELYTEYKKDVESHKAAINDYINVRKEYLEDLNDFTRQQTITFDKVYLKDGLNMEKAMEKLQRVSPVLAFAGSQAGTAVTEEAKKKAFNEDLYEFDGLTTSADGIPAYVVFKKKAENTFKRDPEYLHFEDSSPNNDALRALQTSSSSRETGLGMGFTAESAVYGDMVNDAMRRNEEWSFPPLVGESKEVSSEAFSGQSNTIKAVVESKSNGSGYILKTPGISESNPDFTVAMYKKAQGIPVEEKDETTPHIFKNYVEALYVANLINMANGNK